LHLVFHWVIFFNFYLKISISKLQPYDKFKGTTEQMLFGVVPCYVVQGTLRDQLDRRQLPHLPGSSFLHPAVAIALSHDIAAALMHLHKEGIV
jgi:hypothetical protein